MDGRGCGVTCVGRGRRHVGERFGMSQRVFQIPSPGRLLQGQDDGTALTTVFSGKPARGLRNRFMDEMADAPIAHIRSNIPSRAIYGRQRAKANDLVYYLCGRGRCGLMRSPPAGNSVGQLAEETAAPLQGCNKYKLKAEAKKQLSFSGQNFSNRLLNFAT